ncbi:S8 family serine peptidase [Microlunatus lacustris]
MTPDPAADPSPGQHPPLSGFGPVDTSGMDGSPQRSAPPADLLQRHDGRALDPGTAVRSGGQQLQSTVYRGSRLLVRPTAHEDAVLARLTEIADRQFGLDLVVDPLDVRLRELARAAGIGPDEPQPLVLRVELRARYGDGPVGPPDAWPVLQAFRHGYPAGSPEAASVQLDHVVTPHAEDGVTANPYWKVPGTSSNPYWKVPGTSGNPYWKVPSGNPYVDTAGGLAEYAAPGYGGRTPVAWLGPEPTQNPLPAGRRRPVVAVLDTGIGEHYWLPEGDVVDRAPAVEGLRIGLTDPRTAPEDPEVRSNPLVGEVDPSAGHGTFIAGLVRQKCPDAKLLAVRVVQGDGVVAEADLLEALGMLWLRQALAIRRSLPDQLVDVVSMSLGYYHETPGDAAFDPLLLAPVRALGRLGVVVVVSAGNDATLRPMYPAAFAPHPGGLVPAPLADEVPVVAVGATNPDRSVALFSNEGPWVRAHRPGASLVSTLPAFDGSRSPTLERRPADLAPRATIDPDDFSSGFGVWSGTSFSAPVLVGEIAQHLHATGALAADEVDPAAAVARGWAAVTARVPDLVRPGTPAGKGTDDGDGGHTDGTWVR